MQSRSTTTLGGYSLQDNATESCPTFRSGITSKLSKESPGVEGLMSSQAASLARTFQQQVRVLESRARSRACGESLPASLARYDQASSSWRTAQYSLLGGLEKYSETWPRWGTMLGGVCWGLTMPVRLTNGIGSGSWRTPAANEPGVCAKRLAPIKGGEPGGMNRHYDKENGRHAQIGLVQQVKLRTIWATPKTRDHHPSYSPDYTGNYRKDLGSQVRTVRAWMTPKAHEPGMSAKTSGRCVEKSTHLTTQVSLKNDMIDRNTGNLDKEHLQGQLNPDWTEWLMGWPISYTSLDPLTQEELSAWKEACLSGSWWAQDPADEGRVPRTGTGIEQRINRIKCIGNGQVPACAAMAWQILTITE